MIKEKHVLSGYLLIVYYLGLFSLLIGTMILSPLLVLPFYPNDLSYAIYFIIPAAIAYGFGLIVLLLFKQKQKVHLEKKHDAILVLLTWILAITLSALPFYLSKQMTYTQSFFEATSGYTTTGLTVSNVEVTPKIFLLFRSLMQFYGGVGLILLITSFIADKAGMRLYNAEGHVDKLVPNLLRSARMILIIYTVYIAFGVILYIIFGMPLFDAINHSISAVATGGFSVKAQSIGYYNSVSIEIITMVLMILGGTNFFVHLLIMQRKFNLAFKHVEVKFLGLLTLIFVPMFVFSLMRFNHLGLNEALRIGIFHFFSSITTTGFQTVANMQFFHSSLLFPLVITMIIGGGIGSTAGGMKLYRVSLSLKGTYWNLNDSFSNRKFVRTRFINKLGTKTKVDMDEVNHNYSFLFVYLFILCLGILVLTFAGYGFIDSVFEFTSALGTIGLSYGVMSSSTSNLVLTVGIIGMMIARLESYIIIVAIAKVIIDFKHKLVK
jgi:trk system potassium uptake protein TrkH